MRPFHKNCGIVCLVVAFLSAGYSMVGSESATGISGRVTAPDGSAMEGVAVSARSSIQTLTTSVYTNKNGEYHFPILASGKYKIWAQAVGFETARAESQITANKKTRQDFRLRPLKDFSQQLSGTEWANSLPIATPEDRRMKKMFEWACTNCHTSGFVLSKRFDEDGWDRILDAMIKQRVNAGSANGDAIIAYKDELAKYLTRIRGPEPSPMQFKPLPRVTGEAADIVVTEYDIPPGNEPDFKLFPNGSDWTEGVPNESQAYVLHDAYPCKDGNVYFSDNMTPERTIGKLDPKTGNVTSYKLATPSGAAASSHGLLCAPNGDVWFSNLTENRIDRFDPKTSQFQRFPREGSAALHQTMISVAMDSKGNVWSSQADGALKLNPQTGQYTKYTTAIKHGEPYGVTVDSEDNGWVAQWYADYVSVADPKTGKFTDIDVAPTGESYSARDLEIGQKSKTPLKVPPFYQNGPRRLGADPNGDSVWVGEFYGGHLMKINIHTKQVTRYDMNPDSHPYTAAVDKNHMVWVPLMNGDRLAKFDPFTEKFTEYPLPSLGTHIRFIAVDNTTNPVSIWLSYSGVNKIAHMEFRSGATTAAEKNGN